MILKSIIKNKLVLVTIILYSVTFIFFNERFVHAVQNTGHYLIEMIQVMPVIFMLTLLIEVWISRKTIINNLGNRSGIKGFGFSVVLGSLSAGPIYAAFPICKMLLTKGASISNIIVILSSWAVIKVPMLANEAKFLGPRFMALRWILTVCAIYIMAHISGMLIRKEDIPQIDTKTLNKLSINKNYCIGCGICARMLPDVYEMNQKKAEARLTDISSSSISAVMDTIDKCPSKAIVFHGEDVSL